MPADTEGAGSVMQDTLTNAPMLTTERLVLRGPERGDLPAFTRFNVFLRDGFKCVYCGSPHDLTFDHVVPRSKGGRTTWDNIVAACSPCNLRKGGRMPNDCGMHPNRQPNRPSNYFLQEMGRKFPPHHLHETWMDYLYWDVELDH